MYTYISELLNCPLLASQVVYPFEACVGRWQAASKADTLFFLWRTRTTLSFDTIQCNAIQYNTTRYNTSDLASGMMHGKRNWP